MSKSQRNWIVTLRAKIIICNLILTLKITIDHISISTRLKSTLHDRLDPVIMWPYEVVWLIKNDLSLLPQGLCLPNLTRWRFIVKDNHSWSLWSFDHVIKLSSDWQKMLYLNFHLWLPNLTELWVLMWAYYHQVKNLLITWSHKVTWQMKNVINALSRGLSQSNLTEG